MKNSHTFHVHGGEVNQHGIKFHPDFLTLALTDQQAIVLIEKLAYKLSHKQPISLVYAGALVSDEPSPARCKRCNWPLYLRIEDGCTPENCSMREATHA